MPFYNDSNGVLVVTYEHYHVFEIEKLVDHMPILDQFKTKWPLTILVAIAYLALIKSIQYVMSDRKAFNRPLVLTTWNGLLAIFSICGMLRSWEEMYKTLSMHGFFSSVCHMYDVQTVSGLWYVLFALSKIWELGDTVFLVLRKRPLTFLHCYHHMTVLVYTVQSGSEPTAAGRWFFSMNFTAHAVMYTYYTVTSMGYRLPKFVSVTVTSIQITQMLIGVLISCIVVGIKSFTTMQCHHSWFNLSLCFFIYVTYAILFLDFFNKAYLTEKKDKKKTQ